MEALGIFKFWQNNAAGADVSCPVDDARISASDDDSLFDLDFKSPLKELIESPRDVFLSKTDFWSPNFKPVAILRSAPKFKVFMLGFKKSPRSEKTEASCLPEKIRPAEATAAPVFSRDNSLRSQMLRESRDCEATFFSAVVSPSEKSVPKYLKLINPFYGKASSKTRSVDSAIPSPSPVSLSPRKFGEVSRVGSFKIMTRSLGKSRSASAADGAAPPSIRRRDDSLLEQRHDGIQGAILHCKQSFDSSSHREFSEYSHSWEEQKRCSI